MKQTIASQRLGEQHIRILHPSGLTILLYPMEGFSSAYALFATKYGSIDTAFKTQTDSDFVTVPAGIAHFLEHKLFESEEGDAFSLYAKTGANANAYTSFDTTAYLFSCTENFRASMDILLRFVTDPYFTPETVQKEMGIIGQEIKMYDDKGEWRVFFNLLTAMYHNHPIRVDIAGSVDSIAQIDDQLLYRCYNTFYNLGNMVLSVAGNFDPDEVLAAADAILQPAPDVSIIRQQIDEPRHVAQRRVEQKLPVALPLFYVGLKGVSGSESDNRRGRILDEILLDIIAGEASPLYRRLYDSGLINQTFYTEALCSRGCAAALFSGESRDPDAVFDAICQEVERVTAQGLDPQAVERCKKAAYGRYMGMFGSAEGVAGLMLSTHMAGLGTYDLVEFVSQVTAQQLTQRLQENFDVNHACLSVVRGE